MENFTATTKELLDFIAASPSCYHVIKNITDKLDQLGFEALYENRPWDLHLGNHYYVVRADSSIIAFKIPEKEPSSFQIIASHSDSPSFKIKENPEISKSGHYVQLNIEKYGGMICSSWFDRPLSIAGRAVVEQDGILKTKLVNFNRDLVMLPSLAIHMNRQTNEGTSYKIQTDMIPVFGDETSSGQFYQLLADELGVEKEQILGTDLFLYDRSRPSIWGAHGEYFSSPKLDDLQCVYTSLTAFTNTDPVDGINLCCVFDNEEVGSSTKQGANSTFLQDTLERITFSLGYTREKYLMMVANGFMISADNAHAVHPNHIDKADVTNRPLMNHGPVIKFNANQRYTTDAISASIFRSICKQAHIPTQIYVNHSDIAGGSTLGNISNSHVSINTIDIGAPQLAMHSPYETGGIADTWYMTRAMEAFYGTEGRVPVPICSE